MICCSPRTENAFEHFRTEESYLDLFPTRNTIRKIDVNGRTPCQLSMYMWHAMFGAELKMERRQYDPAIPLFRKMSNLEREIYEEAPHGGGGSEGGAFFMPQGEDRRLYWDSQVHTS